MAEKVQLTQEEQQEVRATLNSEGMRIIAREFKKFGRDAFVKKELCDPLENPGKFYDYKALHKCITVVIPLLVEGLANYQEDAPDKQVKPKWRFSIMELFRPR